MPNPIIFMIPPALRFRRMSKEERAARLAYHEQRIELLSQLYEDGNPQYDRAIADHEKALNKILRRKKGY